MRPHAPLTVAALISAATFALGVGTAAAAEKPPAKRQAPTRAAVDADASAAAARIDEGRLGPRLLLGPRAR